MRIGGVNNMKKYKIAVAGTGYVGLSIATLLSQHHHETAVDIIPEKVEMINNRKSPIQDDYIEKYLAEKELNLTAIIGPYRKLIYALIILLCVAVLFLYSSLLPIIIALTGRFEGQLEFLSGGISMYWPYWLIMSLPIFLLFRRYNVRRSMDEEYSFLYLMFALSIILFQVIGINSESYRISLYFMQFLILLMVKSGCTEYQTFRIILERWCILIFLGAYYVYFFIIALFNHVYPYTSSMLGI